MPVLVLLKQQLDALVGQDVMFHLTDGMVVSGTLSVVGDSFIELENAREASRFSDVHHVEGRHELPRHWHLLYSQIAGFGSQELHP